MSEQASRKSGLADFVYVYGRAIGMLGPDRPLAAGLALANLGVAALQVLEPVLFGRAVDALTKAEDSVPLIAMWAAAGFGAFLFGVTVSLYADRMAHRRRLASMAIYLEHVLALPAAFHSEARSGRLMRVMISGCDSLFHLWLSSLREHLTAAASLVVMVPIALWMNWRLALLLLALLALYVTVNAVVVRRSQGGQSRVEAQFSDMAGRVGDLFGNVSVLQSFLALQTEIGAIRRTMENLLKNQYPVLTWWATLSVLTRAASSLSILAIFALGAWLQVRGQTTVGEIVSFVGFATMLIGRLDQLTSFVMGLFFQGPALAQFFEVLDERSNIVEAPHAKPLHVTSGHVVFEHVTFRYPRGSGALYDISFEAKPGETVALVGTTGAGKTTVLSLLQRAYEPESGRITIDGQDIRDVTIASLRAAIAVVFQEAGLFNRSIAENIRMGKPDAALGEIEEAARIAEAHEFIARKADGYDAMVGERGQGLSGGERQRVAVARALLKNAPILVLDEATSALDVATEARVQLALDRLRQGRTTFVIAHRLSTVREADRIIVLSHGRIVEQGQFDELVARNGTFAALVREGGLTVPGTPTTPAPAAAN